MKKITIYSDPGHAWAKVKRRELVKLGIINNISSCSYERDDFVFLEEDCDLSAYCNKLKELNICFSFSVNNANKSSKIRSYKSFQLREGESL